MSGITKCFRVPRSALALCCLLPWRTHAQSIAVSGYTFYQGKDFSGQIWAGADVNNFAINKLGNETTAQYYVRLAGACNAKCNCGAFK
ncbi:hypothetical protein HYH02_011064 [Chlamydomonas schloesseri]|uniref:Uncharacterized protein n=1 Tax=Chlamydomonas schloesseri TaxID=2026947 RepID=A0A835TF93_9CHLO|nr:hypothetical protein HYH02_011064 [Chlamydomonas schloesseri]|eukprot:KAG2437685.1 hypothetical protein HYH02_011064 [Chlamydomonas schloesseri]